MATMRSPGLPQTEGPTLASRWTLCLTATRGSGPERRESRVLPAWFRSLSPTTEAYEWTETVVDALNDFASYQMDDILDAAREAGTAEQRDALAEYEDDLRRRRR